MRLAIIKLIYIGLVILALGAIFFRCTPEKRLSRLVRKHPEFKIKDTLIVKDSIIVPGSKIDSSFLFKGDTVRIENGRQEIKYYYNTINHHNYIIGTVKPDTIIKPIKVPYDRIKVVEKKSKPWNEQPTTYMILGLLILLAILFIISQLKK